MSGRNPFHYASPCNTKATIVDNRLGKAYETVEYVAENMPNLEHLIELLGNQITYSVVRRGQMNSAYETFLIPYPDGVTMSTIAISKLYVYPFPDRKYEYSHTVLTPEGLLCYIDMEETDPNYQHMVYEWIILGSNESVDSINPGESMDLRINTFWGTKKLDNDFILQAWLNLKDLADGTTIFFDEENGQFYTTAYGEPDEETPGLVPPLTGSHRDVLTIIVDAEGNKTAQWKEIDFPDEVTLDTIEGILPLEKGGTARQDGLVPGLVTARSMITDLAKKTAASFNGTQDVTLGVTGILGIENGGTGNNTGAVDNSEHSNTSDRSTDSDYADRLKTARTFLTNLAINTATPFDGSANNVHGVTGILGVSNGGTGNSTGKAPGATTADGADRLNTARTILVLLSSSTAASFNGTANITPGVSGILGIANGGTGNANGTVARWTTPRTITLTGGVTGSASIDGSANVTIATTVASSGGNYAPLPTTSGIGRWGQTTFTSNQVVTLPGGGTWCYFGGGGTNGWNCRNTQGGIAAGGTGINLGQAPASLLFWRIT